MANELIESLRGDRVSRLRLREAVSVQPTAPVWRAVGLMAERQVGCVLVVEDAAAAAEAPGGGRLIGIFTERDFVTRVMTQVAGRFRRGARRDDPVAADGGDVCQRLIRH